MSVYSTLFFHGPLPAAGGVIYTVPANMTVVVRDIEVYNGSPGDVTFNFQTSVSGLAGLIWAETLHTATWAQWSGRSVVPSGGVIDGYGGGQSTFLALVSGYLLTP